MAGDRLWGLGGRKKPGSEPQYEPSDGSPVEDSTLPDAGMVPPDANVGDISVQTLHRLLTHQQQRIDALTAEVATLRRRLDGAANLAVSHDDQPLAPFPAQPEDRGPGDLAQDFFEQASPRTPRKPAAPPSPRPVITPPSRASTLFAPVSSGTRSAPAADAELIAQRSRAHEFKTLLLAYQALLDGSGGMAEFQRTYSPDFVTTGPGETLRPTVGDEEGPFWFIPLDDRPSLGLLLPSDGPIQQWGELYQFGGGTRAQSVFGRAFEVEPGNVLQVIEPAWIRFDGDDIQLEKRGRLRGA